MGRCAQGQRRHGDAARARMTLGAHERGRLLERQLFVEAHRACLDRDRRASGVRSLSDLSGKRIAVVAGTTNERAIERAGQAPPAEHDRAARSARATRRSPRSRRARPTRSPATGCCWSAPWRRRRTRRRSRCSPTSFRSSPTASCCRAATPRCASRSTPGSPRSTRATRSCEIFRRWFGASSAGRCRDPRGGVHPRRDPRVAKRLSPC